MNSVHSFKPIPDFKKTVMGITAAVVSVLVSIVIIIVGELGQVCRRCWP